jgi:uncharacterized protein YqeY
MERNIIAKRLQNDLKNAIKAKDRLRIGTLRMLISALKNAELEEREELEEDKETAVLTSYARRCRESIAEFERGGRDDLVEKERAEYAIVMQYLPEQLDETGIREIAGEIIAETGASGPRDMGRVMGAMMQRVKGRAEGGAVKNIVLELLKEGQG